MKHTMIAAALGALALAATPVLADEAADCAAGIQFIEAELAKNPTGKVLEELTEALSDAKREQGEQEYDECLEAVDEARAAVGAG
jgi:hypothetical protein